jgi:hypothetical protein
VPPGTQNAQVLAVSMNVPPASVNRSRMANARCSSTVVPKCIVPRHSALALSPGPPSDKIRCSM